MSMPESTAIYSIACGSICAAGIMERVSRDRMHAWVQPHDEIRALSNEELMDQASNGIITPVFIERMHDFGRYLLISSSGELPPNLQESGTDLTPPWSSDYTLDENLQMMMWQVLPETCLSWPKAISIS